MLYDTGTGSERHDMKTWIITQKTDYYFSEVVITARTADAAVNKAKRIWPTRTFISIKAA